MLSFLSKVTNVAINGLIEYFCENEYDFFTNCKKYK